MNKISIYLKNFDWIIFFSAVLLLCFSLAEIYSIAIGRGGSDLMNFKKQIFFVILGIVMLFIFTFLDFNYLKASTKYLYILAIIALLAVLFLGKTINGTKGWFSIFGLGVQPVELVKIILILILANFFSSRAIKIRSAKQLFLSFLITLPLIALTVLQPDFGSAVMLFCVWLIMLAVAGFGKKVFIILAILMMVSGAGLWFFYFTDIQKQRIITFVNPKADSLNHGYNATQAMIAVGSGGIIGRGIGFGSQSQLKFLPEAQTDFIFAVICEELGFLGVSLIFLFFAMIFYRCIAATKKMNNDFCIFFTLGGVGLIFLEMFINISMNIGMLPIVGIALPFVSYGGSSVISNLIMLGMIENIIIKSKINY
jgi:rod shape determining protein RodA